jgi:chromosome partitioning protein
MGKIISIVNQKGGVGKTTTVINLATALASIGKAICVVDLDPQGNASTGFGISKNERGVTIYDVISGRADIKNALVQTQIDGLHIITSNVDLAASEVELQGKYHILKDVLATISQEYDFIMIDCPPSLGMITINALTASESVIIPIQCEFFALEGLSHLMETLNIVKGNLNPGIKIDGILMTMSDKRNNISADVENDVRSHFGDVVYSTVVPRNVKLSEAPSYGKPVLIYDINCPGSVAYIELAKEVIKRYGIKL